MEQAATLDEQQQGIKQLESMGLSPLQANFIRQHCGVDSVRIVSEAERLIPDDDILGFTGTSQGAALTCAFLAYRLGEIGKANELAHADRTGVTLFQVSPLSGQQEMIWLSSEKATMHQTTEQLFAWTLYGLLTDYLHAQSSGQTLRADYPILTCVTATKGAAGLASYGELRFDPPYWKAPIQGLFHYGIVEPGEQPTSETLALHDILQLCPDLPFSSSAEGQELEFKQVN